MLNIAPLHVAQCRCPDVIVLEMETIHMFRKISMLGFKLDSKHPILELQIAEYATSLGF